MHTEAITQSNMDPFNTLAARLVIMEEKGSYIYSWKQWTKEKHNWLCSAEKPLCSEIVSSFGIGGKWCEMKTAFFLTRLDVENANSADITGHSWKEQPAPPKNALFSSREWNQVDISEREWHQNSVILDSFSFHQLGRRQGTHALQQNDKRYYAKQNALKSL